MLKHFDNIIVAECSAGQKKIGVENGGKYICDELKINPEIIFEKKIFNDINSECENGYYILSKYLDHLHRDKKKTLLIGGDHSLGISSVDFLLDKYKDKLRVLWIDAHADINDHLTSLSGNLHGMPLGYHHISRTAKPYWRKQNQFRLDSTQLYYFGIRDLDPAEIKLIKEEHIGYSTKIDEDLIRFIDESEILMISFDVDALDPTHLDSTGCYAPDGLSPTDVKYIINYSIFHNKLIHLDIMEFNPLLGNVKKSMDCLKNIFC